jgi:hypothetical protein
MRRRKWWHRILAWGLTMVLGMYLKTLRLQIFGKDRTAKELSKNGTGSVFLVWHDSLLLTPFLKWTTALRPICVLISNSRDGDLASEIGRHYPNVTVVRVKHTSRAGALVETCKLLETGHSVLITPDGPRGPRHQIKSGALYACQKSGASIIPVVYVASHQRMLSSWDKFKIPLPFSKVLLSFLEPLASPPEGELETIKKEIEQKMDDEETALRRTLK